MHNDDIVIYVYCIPEHDIIMEYLCDYAMNECHRSICDVPAIVIIIIIFSTLEH